MEDGDHRATEIHLSKSVLHQLNLLFERSDTLQISDVSEVRNMQTSYASSISIFSVLSFGKLQLNTAAFVPCCQSLESMKEHCHWIHGLPLCDNRHGASLSGCLPSQPWKSYCARQKVGACKWLSNEPCGKWISVQGSTAYDIRIKSRMLLQKKMLYDRKKCIVWVNLFAFVQSWKTCLPSLFFFS